MTVFIEGDGICLSHLVIIGNTTFCQRCWQHMIVLCTHSCKIGIVNIVTTLNGSRSVCFIKFLRRTAKLTINNIYRSTIFLDSIGIRCSRSGISTTIDGHSSCFVHNSIAITTCGSCRYRDTRKRGRCILHPYASNESISFCNNCTSGHCEIIVSTNTERALAIRTICLNGSSRYINGSTGTGARRKYSISTIAAIVSSYIILYIYITTCHVQLTSHKINTIQMAGDSCRMVNFSACSIVGNSNGLTCRVDLEYSFFSSRLCAGNRFAVEVDCHSGSYCQLCSRFILQHRYSCAGLGVSS